MKSLSLIPELLNYQIVAPFILRLALGSVFIYFSVSAWKSSEKKHFAGIAYIILGILLIIGLYVQGAALIISLILLVQLFGKIRERRFLSDGVNYYLLLLAISVSLLLLGAGAFAFDYPV